MAKLSTLPLDELYAKPKVTRAIEVAIIAQSDFSRINERYCEAICRLKCKTFEEVRINTDEVDVLIIQDHRDPPGKYEKKDAFVNRQEQLQAGVIDFIVEKAGFGVLTYKVTSLLRCSAKNEDFPSGKPPAQTTLQKCFPYLEGEILKSKPKVIISLGTATTKMLGLKNHSNTGNRGEVAMSKYGPVVVTLHPRILSYIRQNARGNAGIWGPDYLNVIIRDFVKARQIASGEIEYGNDTLATSIARQLANNIFIAKSIEDVRQIRLTIDALPPEAIISFDTETTSVDPLDPELRLLALQFGWRDPQTGSYKAAVIPLWHRKNTFYDPQEAWEIVEPILLSDREKVGHNSKFDVLVIYWAKGVRVVNVKYDTLLLLHSIESGTQGCYSLKTAAWDYLLDMGFAGYESLLGDLTKLRKSMEKEAEQEEDEYVE